MNKIFNITVKNIKRFIISGLMIITCVLMCTGCSKLKGSVDNASTSDWTKIKQIGSMELSYADQFKVDYYEDGYSLVTVADKDRYLVVPEGKDVPAGIDKDITILKCPLDEIYLAASSAMDFFRQIDGLDVVKMTGTKAEDWSNKEIADMVANGEIEYAGKYSMPDYEMIMDKNCDVAIESTMIYHSPEVKEQFERIGIPVLVDHSSYETHPLGRVEWIKLYGLLCDRQEEADKFMKQCIDKYDTVVSNVDNVETKTDTENTKKVAFFYINSAGNAVVRKPGDYITKMIGIAGGRYVFSDVLDEMENAMSTMNMQMETFYEKAVEADILIYNSTIDGEITSVSRLIEKNPVLADFKAVKENNVWCTGKNMYQEITGTAEMIQNFYSVFYGDVSDTTYIHKLK
ncbi:MAG: ABC transporter substrate-binding protein [Lachnospiraceae bacterium]|nr:ABC transporter substrate-binding protein [Lachnospiraceae bacterium]